MKRAGILSAVMTVLLLLPQTVLAEEHHGGGGSLPQLDVALYPGVLFWFAVCFVALLVIMQSIGAPGIQKTQAKRASLLGADLEAARLASEEAQKVVAAYEAALAQARQEAQETVGGIMIEAAKESEKHSEKLQKELSHRTAVAEENIMQARQKAMEEAPKYVNDLVQELYGKIMKINLGSSRARG